MSLKPANASFPKPARFELCPPTSRPSSPVWDAGFKTGSNFLRAYGRRFAAQADNLSSQSEHRDVERRSRARAAALSAINQSDAMFGPRLEEAVAEDLAFQPWQLRHDLQAKRGEQAIADERSSTARPSL